MRKPNKIGLVLGGGAPNATLMSGALLAFEERGVGFDVISCTGAGATIGLMYAASPKMKPAVAMRETVNFGVADEIYDRLPLNYKVFNKPGDHAQLFRKMLTSLPGMKEMLSATSQQPWAHFWQDWSSLYLQSLCPSDLSAESLGLCAHVPFIEDQVDFARLKDYGKEIYINAFNLDTHRSETWGKHEISLDHYQAALSFPFLYPPFELGGQHYYEGAIRNCLNFQPFVASQGGAHEDTDVIIVLDVLGIDQLMRTPTSLWDAYVLATIAPLVTLAQNDLTLFELQHNRAAVGQPKHTVLRMPFQIPDDYYPRVLDWSRFNLEKLFRVGYNSAQLLCDTHAELLNIPALDTRKRVPIWRSRPSGLMGQYSCPFAAA